MQSIAFKSAVTPALCLSPAPSRALRRSVARNPRAHSRDQASEAQTAATQLLLTTAFLTAPAGLALAEDILPDVPAAGAEIVDAAAAATEGGPPIAELALVLSPIILYGIFNVYRSAVNPKAKLSDFLFIVAAFAIVSNILSILIFKRRFF